MDPSVAQAATFAANFQPPPQPPPLSTDVLSQPVSQVANPSHYNSQPAPSHPSYAEMIAAAILFENTQGKEGSSKRAIAKYIDRVYSNLPPTHSALLTHHLKRLKNSGQLVMIKNSYQLASARSAAPQQEYAAHTLPQQPSPVPSASDHSSVVKRKPGRPPKFQPQPEHVSASAPAPFSVLGTGLSPVAVNGGSSGKRPRGRPPKEKYQQQQVVVPFVQPTSESNGRVEIVDSATRRGRGRPPKKYQEQQYQEVVDPPPVFQVEVDMVEPEMVQPQPVYQHVPVNGAGVVKRRPGRPAKLKTYEQPSPPLFQAAARVGMGVGRGRGRGRPKRVDNVLAPVSNAVVKKRGWPRGKPRGKRVGTGMAAELMAAYVAGAGLKRRGRKPKGSGMVVEKEKRVYTGKPRGRKPKRNLALVKHTYGQGQETANEDLLMILEDMQSKLRDVIGVIRPHLVDQGAPDALTALQQLEELSSMNVTASPSVTAPPVMTVPPLDETIPPQSTSEPESLVASAPSLTAPTMMTYTASTGMNEPLSYGMNVPSSIETQQPMSWIPSSEA